MVWQVRRGANLGRCGLLGNSSSEKELGRGRGWGPEWGNPYVVPKLAAVCSLLVGPWGGERGREGGWG